MKRSDLLKVKWTPYNSEPIISPPAGSPVIADPTVLLPDESPDGQWHLFAHSIWGIHHYTSVDGITWGKPSFLFRNVMRAYIYQENNVYYLLYEKYRPLQIMVPWMRFWKWSSHIEMRASIDLVTWSGADTLVTPSLPWHGDPKLGRSISNPCLVKRNTSYLLYFSASLSFVPDCGFSEPRYIGVAKSDSITGPYDINPEPLLSPDPTNAWCNLGAGSIKVIKTDDGFVGFQNGIYVDRVTGKSGSAIMMMDSYDGERWRQMNTDPIVKPTAGWQRSHVYACDVKYRASQKRYYLYYNARNDWHWTRGKENIGLYYGEKK